MEADTIHALIEKTQKNATASVQLISNWINLILCISPIVKEMEQKGLLNFKSLVKTVNIRRMTNTGETVSWQKIK